MGRGRGVRGRRGLAALLLLGPPASTVTEHRLALCGRLESPRPR